MSMYLLREASVFGVFLVHIFPHSDRIRKDTPYLSVFSPNAGKYRSEKLRKRMTCFDNNLKSVTLLVKFNSMNAC